MTRTATGRTQHRGTVTRAKLIDAALETLYSKGYAACSLPELCKRAGVSRGAQQHHFPAKADLLAAAVEQLMKQRHEELREAVDREGAGGEGSVDRLVDHLWEIYSGKSFYVFLELAMAARTDPELKARLAAVNQRFYEEATQTLQALLGLPDDPEVLMTVARFVTSMMDGIAVNRILDDDDRTSLDTLAIFKTTLKRLTRGD